MSIDLIFENAQLKGRVIALEAEVKCLEAVVRAHQRLDCVQVNDLNAENARLKAEVERLSKAGDALLERWISNEGVYCETEEAKEVWHAAKGVQS